MGLANEIIIIAFGMFLGAIGQSTSGFDLPDR
jgi:hypothetical protein